MKKTKLLFDEDKELEMNIFEGTEGEQAIDISQLRQNTGLITLDEGYQNTGSCKSAISFVDGEKGILRYRGIPIQELAENSTFVETSYLLIYGHLPTQKELKTFSNMLTENSLIHEEMLHFFDGIPPNAHPMAILSSMVNALSIYYPTLYSEDFFSITFDLVCARLLSKIRTLAAYSYKNSIGEPFVYPRHDLKYTENLLHMMFDSPVKPYTLDQEIVQALRASLILHADHEQNCSTATVRLVGSSQVNLYTSICAGICALWGPLHGGANQQVVEMLEKIRDEGLTVKEAIEKAKSKDKNFVLYGFGHRVYKNYDPRAKILKQIVEKLFNKLNIEEPLVEIAMELEHAALNDDYFAERNLYPNVDYYSGILYKAIGIPKEMFTVMFAIGRLPGWIAHWKEMHDTIPFKIGRPRQIYTGATLSHYIPIEQRG